MKNTLISNLINAQYRATQSGDAFMSDIGDSFRNRAHSNICFAESIEDDDKAEFAKFQEWKASQDNPQPQKKEEVEKPHFTAADFKAFQEFQKQSRTDDKSIYDKHKDKQTKDEERAKERAQIESNAKFGLTFDSLVDENTAFYGGLSSKEFREMVDGLEDDAKLNALKVFAAKKAFEDEEVLELLLPQEREYITNNMQRHESALDGDKMWTMLERAKQVYERISDQNKQRGGGGAGQKTPNYDGFIEKLHTPPKAGFQ